MEIGHKVEPIDINTEMRSSYIDYAMSVIVARALPDARDGLKPVHRRILYAMNDMGIRSTGSHKKSARIVGEVLGKYHPHGDSSVYEAMARLSQDFSMRYPLVDGQGNFGSIDGDSPAAMRYTEARMDKLAEEMLVDIDKDTIDYGENFDGSLKEPLVLPARLPNLLLNGSSGIAVGMATNIPPHNLNELCAALVYMIDNFEDVDSIGPEKLMEFVKGPDFPTGGVIASRETILQAYSTGRGKIIVRGQVEVRPMKSGRASIVITEIPYQLNKTSLIERIAELVRGGRLDGISDLRDESDREGMNIVIEVKRGSQPQRIINQLYKYTALQSTFGVNLLALVNGEPRLLSLKRALLIYIQHRYEVITRRSEHELAKARRREHILQGLLIALANLDDIINTIRQAPDADVAKENLMTRFKLSEIQAQAILDLQLRRLAALERMKIEDEMHQVKDRIAYLVDLLAHPEKIRALIKEDLEKITEKYGDERRTRIQKYAFGEFREEDLVKDEPVLISLTSQGYIKRVSINAHRVRHRGRLGASGQNLRDEDEIMEMIHARTHDNLLYFSDQGKVYSDRCFNIPEAGRADRGKPIINMLPLTTDEQITAIVAVPDFKTAKYCTMVTNNGYIKRVSLSQFESVRPSGLIAISLEAKDKLRWVRLTSGKDDVFLVTAMGRALRMNEETVRAMGRQARGVHAITLKPNDYLTAVEISEPDGYLVVVTENGYGKRTPLDEYPVKGRNTQGVYTTNHRHLPEIGKIVDARVVTEEDQLTIITSAGIVLKIEVTSVSISGRPTRGVHLMDVKDGDKVVSLARIQKLPERTVSAPEAAVDGKTETEQAEDTPEAEAPEGDALQESPPEA
jgi:DNA gyrase subunit A